MGFTIQFIVFRYVCVCNIKSKFNNGYEPKPLEFNEINVVTKASR